jgi:enolase
MSNSSIVSVVGRRIWDSRGRPTVEVQVTLKDGSVGLGIAPAGASRGSREAVDLRDGDLKFDGMDVQNALAGVRGEITLAIMGMDALQQKEVDQILVALDGTPFKSRLGGNATVAVSLAVAHAAAKSSGVPLWKYLAQGRPVRIPLPEIQIFGGGAHAGRRIDIQDLMVVAPVATSFAQALEVTAAVYSAAGRLMRDKFGQFGVADEGGHWPTFGSNEEALEMLVRAIDLAGYTPGADVGISLDIAASEFGHGGSYRLGLEQKEVDSDGMCEILLDWCKHYPIVSIEDPLAEDDPDGWVKFTAAVGTGMQVIGDDYLVTHAGRVADAAKVKAVNAVLIKVNQAGTLSEAHAALCAGKDAGFGTIVSARSGETEDTSVVDLSIGWDAGQLKVGSFSRSERMAKWNAMIRIEEELGSDANYVGGSALPAYRHGANVK